MAAFIQCLVKSSLKQFNLEQDPNVVSSYSVLMSDAAHNPQEAAEAAAEQHHQVSSEPWCLHAMAKNHNTSSQYTVLVLVQVYLLFHDNRISFVFLPCDAMLAWYVLWPCVCVSVYVCLSQIGVLLKWLNGLS